MLIHGSITLLAAQHATRARGSSQILFGLTPVVLSNDLELLSALQSYLGTECAEQVQIVQRRTYEEIMTLLLSGQIDAAWICGYPFVQYRPELALLAVPEWHGGPYYQAYVIVASDRHATSFDDLKSDIHAFSDPNSNSGYLVTAAFLAEKGLRPQDFFSKTFFTYGHRNVVRAVASGLAQSGSVDGYVWQVMKELEPELTDRTRVLRKSEDLGFPPIACLRRNHNSERMQKLHNAFLSMRDKEQGKKILNLLRLNGFTDQPETLFDSIAAKVEALKRVGL